jgi:hypothetical protein
MHISTVKEVSRLLLTQPYSFNWGTAVAQWLRCCATNWKVAGLIPDDVIGIFHWHNPSDRTMALGLTQVLHRNEYQEYFLGVNVAGA